MTDPTEIENVGEQKNNNIKKVRGIVRGKKKMKYPPRALNDMMDKGPLEEERQLMKNEMKEKPIEKEEPLNRKTKSVKE